MDELLVPGMNSPDRFKPRCYVHQSRNTFGEVGDVNLTEPLKPSVKLSGHVSFSPP